MLTSETFFIPGLIGNDFFREAKYIFGRVAKYVNKFCLTVVLIYYDIVVETWLNIRPAILLLDPPVYFHSLCPQSFLNRHESHYLPTFLPFS